MIEKINRTTQNHNHVCCKRYHQESENTVHKWEKIYHIANYMPHKGFVSSYIVLKIINVNNKKTTQLKAQIKDLNKHFSKEDMQWPVST